MFTKHDAVIRKNAVEKAKPWIIKYLPKETKDLVGQDSAIKELKNYISNYMGQAKKAALIYGSSGSGKTSSVYAIANELELEIIEVNASDFRNSDQITSIIGSATKQLSLFAKGKIILVDEIDGLSGTKDRGGIQALTKTIESSSFPIILTATEPYNQKLSTLRSKCMLISYETLSYTAIFEKLSYIAKKEDIKFDETSLKSLARRAGGDMRAAINDLQTLTAHKGSFEKTDLDELSERMQTESVPSALVKILKTINTEIALHALDNINEDQDAVMLWIDENLPLEYNKPEELYNAYNYLSRADVFKRRIRRWQHWRFMVYINALVTAGVAVSKTSKNPEFIQYRQSMRPLRIWQANMTYQKRRSIAEKIAKKTHSSLKRTIAETMHYIQYIIKHNKEMAKAIIEQYDLDKDEIAWLKK
jgi:replication factor C large subunit